MSHTSAALCISRLQHHAASRPSSKQACGARVHTITDQTTHSRNSVLPSSFGKDQSNAKCRYTQAM